MKLNYLANLLEILMGVLIRMSNSKIHSLTSGTGGCSVAGLLAGGSGPCSDLWRSKLPTEAEFWLP